jgi:signal transduction histidine kinase
MQHPTAPFVSAEIESALFAVLVDADSAREGASALLQALAPAIDDATSALAVRDRDGLTLRIIAEHGQSHAWPARFDARVALSAQPTVDPGSDTMVIPLRADGRVIGALLIGDAAHGARLLRDGALERPLETVSAVLGALIARTDLEIRRRASSLRSVEAIVEGMAHQMANPLTGASAMTQLLVEDATEAQRASVEQIRHELNRAFGVLRDMLEFHRDTRAHDGVLDLNSVVERIIRFRGYAIRELGIALDLQTTPTFVPVRCDLRALEHAVLISLRFAELQSQGTINRSLGVRVVERSDGEVAIEINDSGTGDLPQLTRSYFDISFRSEARAGSEIPDLGLADSLLRGCGGRLEARATKTDGTTLALVLQRSPTQTPPHTGRIPA